MEDKGCHPAGTCVPMKVYVDLRADYAEKAVELAHQNQQNQIRYIIAMIGIVVAFAAAWIFKG